MWLKKIIIQIYEYSVDFISKLNILLNVLGGVIGSNKSKEEFVENKMKSWVDVVKKFGIAAKKSPQAA